MLTQCVAHYKLGDGVAFSHYSCFLIGESVDSVCRDDTDLPIA